MKKFLSLFLFLAFVSMNMLTPAYALNIAANTPVLVRTSGTYASNSIVAGDEVHFSVVEDVKSDMGTVLIARGTDVKGKVIKANKRGRIGIPGRINIGEFYTTSSKGETIPLSGSVISEAKSKMALSITLSVIIIPLFLLMRGKDTSISQGAQYTLYTLSN